MIGGVGGGGVVGVVGGLGGVVFVGDFVEEVYVG